MSVLTVTVAPATDVKLPSNLGPLFADAVYTRTVASPTTKGLGDLPKTTQETLRSTLDAQLRGSFDLADIAPSSSINLLFLSGSGAVRLQKTVTPGSGKVFSIALSAAEVAAITTPDPQPVPSTPQSIRNAYFVQVGDQSVPFETSKLQIAPIRVGSGGWTSLGLDKMFNSGQAITTAVEWNPAILSSGALSWTSFHLTLDGQFTFQVPSNSGDAWMWWLSGPLPAIGVVLDDLSVVRVVRIGVVLPPFSSTAPSDSGPMRVPSDVTESEVLNNPDVYTEDPGSFCKPFNNPERVLGERSFFVIFRAEQPVISVEPSIKVGPLPAFTSALPVTMRDTATVSTGRKTRVAATTATLRTVSGAILAGDTESSFVRHTLPGAYLDVLDSLNRGRTDLDGANPVQWEGDVNRYQASTVARGHIIEVRMRWRSNGYSLGTVAKTLTLAPRQARRIEKIEWSRSELNKRQESTTLADQVSDSVSRDRSYDDSVQANLSEWARGQSDSTTVAGAAGVGFVVPPFVVGGGGGASNASSSSSQEGGRRTSASEEQRLRDSIRRYGDSLRKLDSLVVNEISQEETATGTTEVVRNANYGHSLTVIYYQILRHLKIETGVAGVRECLFVPFAITPFTIARAYRWREFIQKNLRDPQYAGAIKYLKDVLTNFAYSNVPPGRRSDQPVRFIHGSIMISLAVDRPADKDDGSFDVNTWVLVQAFLGMPALAIYNMLKAVDESQRDALFQSQQAPTIAANWVDTLQLKVGNTPIPADFTLATRYQFNNVVRVDFSVAVPSGMNVTRETLSAIRVSATKGLNPGSVANLQSLSFTYQTDQFQRTVSAAQGSDDLIHVDTGLPDTGALVTSIPDEWERRDVRAEMIDAVQNLIEHLNEHVEYYHKVIWWNMDRDRLFMLIDGFYIPGTNQMSIASVVERDPIAIIGNAIVFRVSAGSFLGLGNIKTPTDLFNYYVSLEAPTEPMLISLPTDGLYAQTVMDDCPALEEHYGNTDWVLNDPDPALADIAPELLSSRRAEPQATTPSPMPQTLINLQNAPDAPAPSGLAGALSAVTTPNAFRDMAGLAGTQANAASAFQTAANMATSFGSQAASLKLAELADKAHATQTADQKLSSVQRALDKNLVTPQDAQQHASQILQNLHTPIPTPDTSQGAAATKAILAASSQSRPWTVEHEDALGTTTVSLASLDNGGGAGNGGGGSTGSGGTTTAISPFPATPIADPLTAFDQKLKDAFTSAINTVKANSDYASLPNVDNLAIILVPLNLNQTRPVIGSNSGFYDMLYSGSMLKIAAMYAAYQLYSAVNTLAATWDPTQIGDSTKVFAAIHQAFDSQILPASDVINGASTAGKRAPQYEIIFTPTQDNLNRWSLDFRADIDPTVDFAGHLQKMIVDSHNPSAGFCIQALGFSWIDGLFQKAGLFNPTTKHGIWLAGDYLNTLSFINSEHAKDVAHPGTGDPEAVEEFNLGISGWKEVRVPSTNDGPSKQATTCIDAARLLVLLADNKLVAGGPVGTANSAMLGLLHNAVTGGAPSVVGRVPPVPFTILQSKIGFGTLGTTGSCLPDATGNTNGCVLSEAMIVKQAVAPFQTFVVVWENVKDPANRSMKDIERVRDIIQNTMTNYNP
jgi:hypothetical protein